MVAAQVPHRGKEKRLSLGTWPEIGLKEARDRREKAQARSQLTLGVNPGVLRKSHWAAQMAIDIISFEVVARE